MTTDNILRHVGFIADGNRRWARSHGLPTLEGHRRGFDRVEVIIDALKSTEVKFVSFFLFSTENWDRSPEEVSYLMDLVSKQINKLTKKLKQENIRILLMGRPEPVDPKLWAKMLHAESETMDNTGQKSCVVTSIIPKSPILISSSVPPANNVSPVFSSGALHIPNSSSSKKTSPILTLMMSPLQLTNFTPVDAVSANNPTNSPQYTR